MAYKPQSRAAPARLTPAEPASSGLSSGTTALLIGGAVVLAGAAAYFLLRKSGGEEVPAPGAAVAEPESEDEQPVKIVKVNSVPKNDRAAAVGGAGRQADEDDDVSHASGGEEGLELAEAGSGSISKKDLLNLLEEMFARVSELQARSLFSRFRCVALQDWL